MKKPYMYAFADEACSQMEGQIAALRRNGLDGLEIRGVNGQNITQISIADAKEVRKQLDDEGLITWSIGSPIGKISINDDFEAHKETYRHTLEIANILGAANLRLFSFYIPTDKQACDCRSKVIDRMGELLNIGRNSGIELCHENEKGIYGDIADRCLDLHQTFPELCGVFDPANFVQCGEDTLRGWSVLKPYTHYLHIKDALPDGSVVPAGKGCGNVPYIVRDFLSSGGTALTIEPHLTVFDGLKELERSGETSSVGERYVYPDANAAFDAACDALKELLRKG